MKYQDLCNILHFQSFGGFNMYNSYLMLIFNILHSRQMEKPPVFHYSLDANNQL